MAVGCIICGQEKHELAYACRRCKRLIDRVETRRGPDRRLRRRDVDARIRALQKAWDSEAGVFRCHYTRVALTEQPTDRRYLTFDHQTPGVESDLVLVASLVNRMKTDLSDAEFRTLVVALASGFAGRQFDPEAFPDIDAKEPPPPPASTDQQMML